MDTLFQDLRFAFRMLRKSPAFTAMAVLTLALGIGANTAIYSVINAILFHPFAAKDLGRMVAVWETVPRQSLDHISVAPANFREWSAQNRGFDLLAAGAGWGANLSGGSVAERVEGYRVTAGFFPLFGIAPQVGGWFAAEDFQPGHPSVVVLSHGIWEREFGADRAIVGRKILLDGEKYEVIGVMPEEMDYPPGVGVWAPLIFNAAQRADRTDHYLQVIGHLRSGVTISEAEASLQVVAAGAARDYPQTNAGHSVQVVNMVDDLGQGVGPQLARVLMGATGFVLLLACANVGNLLLARAIAREKEIAVRSALGASRRRIARQLLLESSVLSFLSAVPGLLLAVWGLALVHRTTPAVIIQHVAGAKHLGVDARVFVYTLFVTLLTGILAGLAPVLHLSHPGLMEAIKGGSHFGTSRSARRSLRAMLVVTEMALALVLLVSAGLMVKGFRNLLRLEPGFDRGHLLTFHVTLSEVNYREKDRVREFYDRVVQGLDALPGVESAAIVTNLPSGRTWTRTEYALEGQPPAAPGEMRVAISQQVSLEFFRTLRAPLVKGRSFSSQDGPDATPVVIISETLARRLGIDADPVGKRIKMGRAESNEPWRTIVGVAGNIRQFPIDLHPEPAAYVPFSQSPLRSAALVVRTRGDPMALASSVSSVVKSVDPNQPVYDLRTLEQLFSDNVLGLDYAAGVMMVFGVFATLLAAAGAFAVAAYSVAQRTHEIGVRMALGARPSNVVMLVMGSVIKLAILGLGLGVVGVLAMGRALGSLLFGVLQMDAATLAGLTALLAFIAALAAFFPARRAAKVDPLVALRSE